MRKQVVAGKGRKEKHDRSGASHERANNKRPWKSPQGAWIGKVEVIGDIVNLDSSHLWEAAKKRQATG